MDCLDVGDSGCGSGGGGFGAVFGGGCVLQGLGCLNFSLALTHKGHPQVRDLRPSYCYILNALCGALKTLGVTASHNGISDIVVDGRKVSGNAQKRRKYAILHHGTLLYAMAPEGMARYLREPADRPDYRGERTHGDFVRTLPFDAATLRSAVRAAFSVTADVVEPLPEELAQAQELVETKYGTEAWSRRR
jgi:lipoate-protein ligase A